MNRTVLAWMAGSVFILGALQCMFKGSVALRSGHRIERSKDPVGFWGVVVGLFLAGVCVVSIGVAQAR